MSRHALFRNPLALQEKPHNVSRPPWERSTNIGVPPEPRQHVFEVVWPHQQDVVLGCYAVPAEEAGKTCRVRGSAQVLQERAVEDSYLVLSRQTQSMS